MVTLTDPDAEVIALSPRTLVATKRYICDVCHKGFQRDQNLQLHRRGHNLPWKLKQKSSSEAKKKVYVCPEVTCAHHDPKRALGDLTGIKKHYSRKHGDKKWKCDKCGRRYAVQSDWKAHFKSCGTKDYRCGCGTVFSRKDSFVTHRAFCEALAHEESYMANNSLAAMVPQDLSSSDLRSLSHMHFSNENLIFSNPQISSGDSSYMSAAALLQRAADMSGSSLSDESLCPLFQGAEMGERRSGGMTKDFLGLGDSGCPGGRSSGNGGYFENEFYSCQQMSHGWTPFEKDMWH